MPPNGQVAAANAAPPVPNNQEQGRQQGGFGSNLLMGIFRAIFFWWIMSMLKGNNRNQPYHIMHNNFQKGEKIDIGIYISPILYPSKELMASNALWNIEDFALVTNPKLIQNVSYTMDESVQRNGSVYLHVYVARQGYDYNPYDHEFERDMAFYSIHKLNRYMKKPKEKIEKHLLTQSSSLSDAKVESKSKSNEEEEDEELIISNYMLPKIDISFVDFFDKCKNTTFPVQLKPFVSFDKHQNYYPVIFFNDFWVLRENMVLLNETVESVDIEISLTSIRPFYVQILTQFEETFKMQTAMGINTEEESDEFKRIFIEGNPIFLCITFAVSILHSIFDFLAFKNEIGFWRNNRSMEGLSARSILINAGCQVVVLLYLFDNETSFVVLMSMVVGVLIEFWKVTKAMKVSVNWYGNLPYLKIEDRISYSESETRVHDETAMRYLSYALYPMVICYAFYNLATNTYKSWYSWIVSSLAGAVYMFGFILMCPQLYLNYKLKSVAHLPWRQLTYKFLNTIIDDLFAFAIKMPLLHRLSVFRDDIVFLIYLYQWYIYGVDRSRVNEFGFSAVSPSDDNAGTSGNRQRVEQHQELLDDDTRADHHDARMRRRRRNNNDGVGVIEEIDNNEDSNDMNKKDN